MSAGARSSNLSNGAPVPHYEDAERRILGAVLSNPEFLEQCAGLTDEHFFDERHRLLFRRILQLAEDGEPIEVLSVQTALSREQWAFVSALPDDVPPDPQLQHYIEILNNALTLRRILAAQRSLDPETVIARTRAAIEEHDAASQTRNGHEDERRQILTACEFNAEARPPAIRPVYDFGGVTICTPGNLTAITAQAKTGKSALVNAMLAAAMTTESGVDTLSVTTSNESGFALLHFDTEQSPEDHWNQIMRAMRRARTPLKPDWLLSYCFTGKSAADCKALVWQAVSDARQRFRGIHSVLIDGVADLVVDVNEAAECNTFVAGLHALAIEHDAPIVGVIHFNPGTEKVRGHLGSQLERKAETNLILEKDGDVTVCWSAKQRRAPILKDFGPRFKWNDERGMHLLCESQADHRSSARLQQYRDEVDDVFHDRRAMRYSDLVAEISRVTRTNSSRTAETRFSEYKRLRLIRKTVANLWEKGA